MLFLRNFVTSLIMCLLLIQPVFAFGTYKKLDLMYGKSKPQTDSILYEYILKEQNMTPKQLKDFVQITPENVKAFKVDLNNDGIDEIVGTAYSTFYCGTAGYSLFILQKQPNGYKNISILVFEPQEKVDIRRKKTNGYHDIKLVGSNGNGSKYIAQYKDGMYQWAYKL